jgi:hypothetical protein
LGAGALKGNEGKEGMNGGHLQQADSEITVNLCL